MCKRAFPRVFDLATVTSSNWRHAPLKEVLAFTTELFMMPRPILLGTTDASRARKCMATLAITRPDKFEKFYANGNLNESTEGIFWLAANQVLGSRWNMKMPVSSLRPNTDSKGNKKVAFHRSPGATVHSSRTGTFIRQSGNCSGNCQAPIDVTAEVHRNFSTYITIGLPRSTPPAAEMYDYAVQSLIAVFRDLYTQDQQCLLYVFPTKARKSP